VRAQKLFELSGFGVGGEEVRDAHAASHTEIKPLLDVASDGNFKRK
jgi:hypothetical protein